MRGVFDTLLARRLLGRSLLCREMDTNGQAPRMADGAKYTPLAVDNEHHAPVAVDKEDHAPLADNMRRNFADEAKHSIRHEDVMHACHGASHDPDKSRDLEQSLVALLDKYPSQYGNTPSEAARRAGGNPKGKKIRPEDTGHALCVFYWILVLSISCLIAFSIWLSVQISFRHALMLARRARSKPPFSFDDIFNSSLQPRSFSADWVHGEDAFTYTNDDGHLILYNITANDTSVLVDSSILDDYWYYWVSPDLQYVLLAYSVKTLWRHSFYAIYDIYDVQDGLLSEFPNDDALAGRRLQYAGWSSSGHALAFVYGNDVYYQEGPFSDMIRLTNTGTDKIFFNGVPDWLYEEEILASHYALWWSPDSRRLVYGVFNCTNVPIFKFPYYGPKQDVYGSMIEIAYPKSGDLTPGRNTLSSLKVVNLDDLEADHETLPPPRDLENQDHYFLRVAWRDEEGVMVAWANRVQNLTIMTLCNVTSHGCVENDRRSVSGGWIDILPTIWFVEEGESYLTRQPVDAGDTGEWYNLAVVTASYDESGDVTFLTREEQEVKSIVGYDVIDKRVYYISTHEYPGARHLFSIPLDGSTVAECVTCDIVNCSYVTASFSSSGRYYVLGCRGPAIPQYWLKHTLSDYELVLEDNADVAANLAEKDLPRVEYRTVPIGGGYDGYAKVLVPPAADRDPNGKFPLIVETYGGPGSQAVDFRYNVGFETYLASSENAVYAFLDGRGTTSRGQDFKHLLYKRMATLEVEDQITGCRWFKDNLPYVDADKNAAIWGWSYGGFLTSHAVANESQEFMCGISGAALIDRRYYDTAHSERYMGFATPEDNEDGYERTDVTNKVEGFRNKHFLLVHGTADDNVHFASSAQLVRALEEAEIQFRFQLYTDLDHYFMGDNRHIHQLFTDFLLDECWANAESKAIRRRQKRVVDKNIKLHGLPDRNRRAMKNN